ncbi:MAG TPA: PQQ-binding-like beta-propeller repeat protein [Dongiaceae bacterium]|nr:PQQ-binding-like beta-propeller repeat protein [Dongiaceae bacterium]
MHRTLLAVALLLCPLASAQESSFRAGPAHMGVYGGAGAPAFHKVKWQFHTGGQVFSSPAIANGLVYVGSNDHFLHALDLANGGEKWKFKTAGRIVSSPAVSDGTVFFLSYDSNFYAVDAASGTEKWKFKTGGEHRFIAKHLHGIEPANEPVPDPFDFYLSSPAVSGGVVYFGSSDGCVYALEAGSGALKWKFKTGDVVHASPAVAGGTVFVGSWDTYFYALDAATGAEKWRFKTGEDHEIYNQTGLQASAAVVEGVVYFGCRDSNFYALDAATGKSLWTYKNNGSWVIGSAAVVNGRVYFATSDTGLLHAVDAKSGQDLFSLAFNRWPMFSSPAIAGNTLYLGSHQGRLLAIDLPAQKLAWMFETDAARKNGAAVTTPDGKPNHAAAFADSFYDDIIVGIQKMFSNGAVLSSPAISGSTVVFGSLDGNIYAVE